MQVKFLLNLLQDLNANGHRTLVFSQSRKFLDLIEPPLRAMGLTWKRIDGNVTSACERQSIVNEFQSDSTIPLCLLTTQVGGLGLTLTAADRVVILDPAWNPRSVMVVKNLFFGNLFYSFLAERKTRFILKGPPLSALGLWRLRGTMFNFASFRYLYSQAA